MFLLTITNWVAEARISIKTGKQNNLRLIDVEKVVNGIDYENKASACAALLGLHVFTACDKTSGLHGCGKVKALRAMPEYDSLETFTLLGQE